MPRRPLSIPMPPPPSGGGDVIGWNHRRDLSYTTDAPEDTAVLDANPLVILRTNGNAISRTSGWTSDRPCTNRAAPDARLNGDYSVSATKVFQVNTAAGDYRLWLGCGSDAAEWGGRCELYDGATSGDRGLLLTIPFGQRLSGDYSDAQGNITNATVWVANYDTSFINVTLTSRSTSGFSMDFVVEGPAIRIYPNHVRIEQL